MNLKERAKRLRQDIPAVFLALRKKETPAAAKLLAGITVAYALSPVDLIPDFIPVLGYLDDLLVLPALIALTVRLIPPAILADCRRESADLWKGGKPRKWYYALPVLAVWAIALFVVLWLLFGRNG